MSKNRVKQVITALLLAMLLTASACGGAGKDQQITKAESASSEAESEGASESEAEESESEVESTEAESESETETETVVETKAELTFTDVSETVWATSNVNMRTAPGTNSDVITVLGAGKSVTRTGVSEEGWSRADYDGQVVYISSEYLTTTEPETQAATAGGGIVSGVTGGHIIAIDPGHQAHGDSNPEPNGPNSGVMKARITTGTQGVATGITEANLNLTVSLQLRDALVAKGYQVVMTRESQDVSISNMERAIIANNSGAEILVRVHANSSANSGATGILTMCPSASNPYVSYLYDASYRLSSLIVNQMCAATGANNQGVLAVDDMTGINWSTIPVTIVEMGYMSNPTEDVLLNSADYQAKMVSAMVTAIDQYFGN